MAKNTGLSKAKDAKKDEFYTQIVDIENELKHYRKHFEDAVVLCNCDDPDWSNFWKYFYLNFEVLGLKKLISTHYDPENSTYKMEYDGTGEPVITNLEGNGDFRSPECIELLKEASIVVTNPPFSLFREYVAQLMEYKKKFLIIGNQNAITYKEIFPLIKDGEMWLGHGFRGNVGFFGSPYEDYAVSSHHKDGLIRVSGVMWFTNLDHSKRHEELILYKNYNPEEYPTYDNYDAIEVSKTVDIPVDYDGVMGVPVTFLDKYNPEQFEIVGGSMAYEITPCHIMKDYVALGYKFVKADGVTKSGSGALKDKMSPKLIGKGKSDYSISPDGECLYAVYGRIFIKHKKG